MATTTAVEDVKKISTESGVSESTLSEALVAPAAKDDFADSGNLTCLSSQTFGESSSQDNNKSSMEQNKLSLESKCSQESGTKASSVNENSNSSFSSAAKVVNEDEDSRLSVSSSASTVKTSQHTVYNSSDESNSKSSSPVKKDDDESKPSCTDDDSRSTSKNSQPAIEKSDDESKPSHMDDDSRSTTKNSQPVIEKSDDESNSRSSAQLPEKDSNSRSSAQSPEKESNKSQTKRYFSIVDSDSDDDIVLPQRSNADKSGSDSDGSRSSKSEKEKKKRKIYSDSDEESVKSNSEKKKKKKLKKKHSMESNDSDTEKSENVNKSNRISNIVDSDSESGSDSRSRNGDKASSGEENDTKNIKSTKKKKGSQRASKEAAMQEIRSETQRLIREAAISLPYHRPKQRTLQEFLSRKKVTSEIPTNLTYTEKVKMFPDVISKVIQEKEEEAENFYKSSDSEEEKDEPMEVDETSAAAKIDDTQKSSQENIQDANDKITELQQRSLDLGVSRKLFMDDVVEEKEKTENSKVPEEETINTKVSTDEEIVTNDAETSKKNEEKNNDSTEEFVLKLTETESRPLEEDEEIVDRAILKADFTLPEELREPKKKLPTESLPLEENEEIVDRAILNADFTLPEELREPKKKLPTLKEIFLSKALLGKPTIKGSPGSMIDFSTSPGEMKEGVTKLMDRFTRHSAVPKVQVNEISEVKTIRTEGSGNDLTIVEEILPFARPIIEDDPKKDRKPGEKFQKLREELKKKIASARNDELKQREEEEKEDEEETAKCKGDDFYEGLPDEEEEEMDEEVSTESEPEEDDVPLKETRRSKCAFGDDEAEVSEDEKNEDEDENEEDEEEEEEEEEESEKEEISDKPKQLKRIIRPFDEDSNDSKSSTSNDAKAKLFPTGNRIRKKTDDDIFASQTSNGSEDLEADSIPPFQSRDRLGSDSRSQACKTPLPKPDNLLSMVSPVTQLTALNTSGDSGKKSASKTPNVLNLGPINASNENTPTDKSGNRPQTSCTMEKMASLQKKLFEEPPEVVNDTELLEICSGRFTNTQSTQRPLNSLANGVTDSQLMELCSGAFVSQPVDLEKLESSRPELADETSQDITLTLEDDENSNNSPAKTVSSLKRSDESMFSNDSKSPVKMPTFGGASSKNPMEAWLTKAKTQPKSDQVTDSQLMDLCSGAFTSQAVDLKELEENDFQLTLDDNTKSPFKQTEQPRTTFTIVSSSDEEDVGAKKERPKKKKKLPKKKKVKKLALSDDEDEDEAKEFSDEEEEIEEEEDEEKFVDYDSEENEVVVVPKGDIKKVAKNFLENEAELSESDWGSADEDEQGLDKFEFEEADAEDIDVDKMKEQLGRVHMKQVMDEDQREVRLLQELLFDDGDLHSEGAGRERKFKWKNIDSLGDLGLTPRTDDNGDEVDDEVDAETEVQMRKMRYEQQKFLEEKQKSLDAVINEDFGESQLLNRGLKVVSVKSTSKTSVDEQKMVKSNSLVNGSNILLTNNITTITKTTLTNAKSLSFTNMKGSFLSRGEETLVRIAQNLPEKTKISAGAGRKGNFVFQHLSPSVSKAPKDDSEQENDDTPAKDKNKKKRKMFASQGSGQTPRSTKKLKVDDRSAGKKLF